MTKEWMKRKNQFDVVDVRKLTGNCLPKLLNKAAQIDVGELMDNFGEKNPEVSAMPV